MNFKEIAIKAAKEAGKIQLYYLKKGFKIGTKSGQHDRVTTADLECEKKIVEIIKKDYPDHNILAEENNYEKTDSGYTWIIDPIDGTNNYSHGYPFFCTSIALAKNDEVIMGVVYNVNSDELFVAEKGKGAFLNNKEITVSNVKNLEDALLVTGFYYDRGKNMIRTLDEIKHFLIKKVNGIRRSGSAALDLCFVACGRIDGFWEFTLSPWDYAAAKLIIEEAGGKVTDKADDKVTIKPSFIVSSNKKIHSAMLKILNKK
jgi:myo-inositol-1(or 4)-monophosphatase